MSPEGAAVSDQHLHLTQVQVRVSNSMVEMLRRKAAQHDIINRSETPCYCARRILSAMNTKVSVPIIISTASAIMIGSRFAKRNWLNR